MSYSVKWLVDNLGISRGRLCFTAALMLPSCKIKKYITAAAQIRRDFYVKI